MLLVPGDAEVSGGLTSEEKNAKTIICIHVLINKFN
jgi:hypothetical protein